MDSQGLTWPVVLGSAAVGAIVSSAVGLVQALVMHRLTSRADRIRLATEMAKVLQDYQQMLGQEAARTGTPTQMHYRNPLFELTHYLEILDVVSTRRPADVREKLQQWANSPGED
jgi:hypothetical protein